MNLQRILLLLILTLTLSGEVKGQTIGDYLDFIQIERFGGELRTYDDFMTYESYDQTQDITWLFFFGKDSVCNKILIHPESPEAQQAFLMLIGENCKRVDETIWSLRRGDGSFLITVMLGEPKQTNLFLVRSIE